MPIENLALTPAAWTYESTDIEENHRRRGLVRHIPSEWNCQTYMASHPRRIRYQRGTETCAASFAASGILGRLPCGLALQPAAMNLDGDLHYFVHTALDVPPPALKPPGLYFPSVEQMRNPNYQPKRLHCSRVARGDQIRIEFALEGKRLGELFANFAARKPRAQQNSIQKSDRPQFGGVRIEDKIDLDPNTGIETRKGAIYLNPGDTYNFPDIAQELVYDFEVTDGQGRTHTLEQGSFCVYPDFALREGYGSLS